MFHNRNWNIIRYAGGFLGQRERKLNTITDINILRGELLLLWNSACIFHLISFHLAGFDFLRFRLPSFWEQHLVLFSNALEHLFFRVNVVCRPASPFFFTFLSVFIFFPLLSGTPKYVSRLGTKKISTETLKSCKTTSNRTLYINLFGIPLCSNCALITTNGLLLTSPNASIPQKLMEAIFFDIVQKLHGHKVDCVDLLYHRRGKFVFVI